MKHTWIALAVLVLLFLAAVVDMACYYPILPQRMASHFDWQGNADGWSTKPVFFVTFAALVLGIAGLLSGVGLVVRWIPPRMISMPNKDYWLAPQRRDETWVWVTGWFLWFANATMLLQIGCMHIIFRANLQGQPGLGWSPMILLVLYLAFTTVWCIAPFRRFRMPRENEISTSDHHTSRQPKPGRR